MTKRFLLFQNKNNQPKLLPRCRKSQKKSFWNRVIVLVLTVLQESDECENTENAIYKESQFVGEYLESSRARKDPMILSEQRRSF